jgi:transcriptional regulator with XRE-family HTH domain
MEGMTVNKVKEICIRKGIVQKELASMVGVSQPTVSDWWNNKKDPSGARLEKLSAILGVGRAVILGYDELPAAQEKSPGTDPLTEQIMAKARTMNEEELRQLLRIMDAVKK